MGIKSLNPFWHCLSSNEYGDKHELMPLEFYCAEKTVNG